MFSSHSTHITQLLDVGCFQLFKHYHTEAVDTVVRFNINDFDKLDFLAVFDWIRIQIFIINTILSVFRKTGFVFYNPEIIFEKIRNLLKSRNIISFSQSFVFVGILYTAQNVIKFDQWFQNLLITQIFVISENICKC